MVTREPTVIIGGVAEVVRAVIPMLLIFGVVHWTDAQTGTIIFFVGVLVSFAEKMFIRSQVVSVSKSDALVEKAIEMPSNTTLPQVIAAEKKEYDAS